MRQCALSEGMRVLQMVSQQMRLTEGKATERLKVYSFCCSHLCHRLCEQWHSVSDASAQGIRHTQGHSHQGEEDRKVPLMTDTHGAFEPWKGLAQVALAER